MQKLSSLLFTTLISISIIALAQEGMAQTSAVASAAHVVSTNDNTRSRAEPKETSSIYGCMLASALGALKGRKVRPLKSQRSGKKALISPYQDH
jgi:hypothetical protein